MKLNDDILSGLPFWGQLSTSQRAEVAEMTYTRLYSKGSIVGCGSNCLGLIQVLRGGTRVYLLSPEGREVTLYRLGVGDCCVLTASCVMSQITFETNMVAEEETELLILPAHTFSRLTGENIHVRCCMYELATRRFSAVMFSLQQVLFARFDRRLASFLLSEAERTGSRELRLTHEEIARQVSSAREVVARMLKRFASDGLVSLRRGVIRIERPAELKKILSE